MQYLPHFFKNYQTSLNSGVLDERKPNKSNQLGRFSAVFVCAKRA